MNKPVLRSTQMKNVNSLLSSTFGATTTSLRPWTPGGPCTPGGPWTPGGPCTPGGPWRPGGPWTPGGNTNYCYIQTIQTILQNLKNLQTIIQDKLPNLGLLEQLNFKIVNDLKFLPQLQLNLQQLQLNLQQPNLQQPYLQLQQILSIIRIQIENDPGKISSMLNDLKELKQKLEQFSKEIIQKIIQKVNLISPLIALENVTNFIETERSRLQLPEAAINVILKPYIDQRNSLTSETQTVLNQLKLPLSSTSNNVLDTLPTEIQELVKRINSYRGFII